MEVKFMPTYQLNDAVPPGHPGIWAPSFLSSCRALLLSGLPQAAEEVEA